MKEPEKIIAEDLLDELESTDYLIDDYYIAKKLVQLKQSADSRKLEFSLSFKTVKKLMTAKTCFYTGEKFTKKGNNHRTIDRIDSSKGYIEGNVVACTFYINSKKSNLSIEEIHILSTKINQYFKKKK